MYLAETFTFAAEMSLSETSMAEKSGHQIKHTHCNHVCKNDNQFQGLPSSDIAKIVVFHWLGVYRLYNSVGIIVKKPRFT